MFKTLKTFLAIAVSFSIVTISNVFADGHMAAIKKWSNGEFSLSTLSAKEREKELEWFHNAAKPFKGMSIKVLSETIPTHEYESKVLTKAFEEITGIKVNHQLLGEGDVVMAVQTQMQTNVSIYDAYINDSDLIGTHARMQQAVNLTKWMAGEGDVGKPNGIPVDEWGIRMEKGSCNPVGASVTRGGAANGPAAVYAIRKWDEWLRNYAPPGAAAMDFYQSLPSLSSGNVAQQIFWYTAFTASLVGKNPNNKVVDDKGMPLWRMGPSPKGPYWEEGMKLGYQDAGSWTLFKSTPVKNRKAAWLYAQFVVSKTVDLKKSHVGLTIIRDSSIDHKSFTERAPALGGLVEFYRSNNRNIWSPTGVNVPDYPKLAQIWWQQIGDVNSGAFTPQQAMDRLAEEMDLVMSRMEAADKGSNAYGGCGPRLNKPREASYWLNQKGSPKAKRNEKPQGKTVPYSKAWK